MALSLRLCLAGGLLAANLAHGADLITFWDARPRLGVNIMNRQVPDAALYRAARAQGVEWVRLAYDKWQPAQRDFLIGNADRYQGLVAADLATLRRTLYAYHMYEPYLWSNPKNHKQATPWRYPGVVAGQRWDKDAAAAWLAPAHDWARAHRIPASRMAAAEFGCHRRSPGCAAYLEDVLQVVEGQGAHWAVYAWREDAYDGYDYELGDKALPWQYWQAQEQGKFYELKRANTVQWQLVARRLAATRP